MRRPVYSWCQNYKIAGDDLRGQGHASYILGYAYLENDDAETALLVRSFLFMLYDVIHSNADLKWTRSQRSELIDVSIKQEIYLYFEIRWLFGKYKK